MNLKNILNTNLYAYRFRGYLFINKPDIEEGFIIKENSVIEYQGSIAKYASCVNLITEIVTNRRFNHVKGEFGIARRGLYEVCTLDSVNNFLLFDN